MTLAETKRAFRLAMADALHSLAPRARLEADAEICSAILRLSEYHACEQVLSYVPLKDEVDVTAVGRAAINAGKEVYLPVTFPERGLEYRRWHVGDVLARSELGVLEPVTGDSLRTALRTARALILVPGRGFSPDGWRLGRGGGYYDRALRWLSRIGTTVGVAYQCQVVSDLPRGPGDEKLDRIITELARYADFR